jgi:hypothetical protein
LPVRGANNRLEARLLLALLAERWQEAEALAERPDMSAGAFINLVTECEISPWVHHLLQSSGKLELIGEQAGQELERSRHKCRVDNLHLLTLAEGVLDALLEAGIVPLALKGLDQIHRFGIEFGARAMVDMDLLVRPDQLQQAILALQQAGWATTGGQRHSHWLPYHMAMMSAGPVRVFLELHWNLVQPGRYRMQPEQLFERAVQLEVCGRNVLGLEAHDHAAYLLLHHISHYLERRLKGALDLKMIVERQEVDWALVAHRLTDWGGLAAGAMSLRHMAKLFPGTFSEPFRPGLFRTLLTLPLRSPHPLDLFRGTRLRPVQFYLGALLLERPLDLLGKSWRH